MNEFDEVPRQNLLDGWAMLYADLTESIMITLGRKGEGIIREAVRHMGTECGEKRQQLFLEHNIKTNLHTLFFTNRENWIDPRFRQQLQHEDEESYINEIITCPLADFWILNGAKNRGRWFCEEFYHAMMKAYSYGISQTNISDTLTHDGDNHCRFSIYMRAACLNKDKRSVSYKRFDIVGKDPLPLPEISVKTRLENNSLLLYYKLLETAVEGFGKEGECALALGLRKLGISAASYVKRRAHMTGNPANHKYAEENFPLGIKSENSLFWNDHKKNNAKELFSVNFISVFKKEIER